MYTSFTDWNRQDSLAHYGIPGMKWGVRRYMNKDGSLTAAGKKRYGEKGTGSGPRKSQRDFNKLDKSYANVQAEQNDAILGLNIAANRAAKRINDKQHEIKDVKQFAQTDRPMLRYQKQMKADAEKIRLTEQQKQAIESLQLRIIGHAAKRGYTTKSKAVIRIGNTVKDRVVAAIGSAPTGGILAKSLLAGTGVRVHGQQVTIRKKGDGDTRLVNYYRANHPDEEKQKKKY